MLNKMTDYKFIPRNRETTEQVKEFCMNDAGWRLGNLSQDVVFAAEKKVRKNGWVKIYGDSQKNGKTILGSIYFWGKGNLGAEYRKMDMQKDVESFVVGDANSPTCASLNFEHSVVGSDEVGTSERFKQIVVSAAYVTPEDMDTLIAWNVRDSKEMTEKQLLEVGKALTGISTLQAVEIFEKGGKSFAASKEKGALVNFCSVALSNQEYDAFRREKNGKDKNDLLCSLHAEVLNPLIREYQPDYAVVDDFMENDVSIRDGFCESLECGAEKVLLRTQADVVNMAVSCASVISAYISALYVDWLNNKLIDEYNLDFNFKLPTGNDSLKVLRNKFYQAGATAEAVEEILEMYAKSDMEG